MDNKGYKKISLIIVAVFFLLENILFFGNRNTNHPIIGTRLNGIDVSSLTKKEVISLIKGKFFSDTPLRLKYQDRIFEVNKADVGAEIDYQGTIDLLFSEGRERNLISNIISQNVTFLGFGGKQIKSRLSSKLLTIKVLSISDEINQEPKPPMPDFTGDISKTVSVKRGVKVNSFRLSGIIRNNIFRPPSNAIVIPTSTVLKSYNPSNLDQLRKQAVEYTSRPISMVSGGVAFTLTPSDLRSIITVVEKVNPKNPNDNILALSIDAKKLNQKLDSFARNLESVTGMEFNEYYVRSVIYSQFYSNTRKLAIIPGSPIEHEKVLGASTSNGKKTVFLTFDDGPNIIYQPMILDILKSKNIHATFYFVGSNSQRYKTVTQRTIDEGNAIGDHTLTHALLPKLPPQKIFEEIKSAKDILNSFLAPNKITLFRPPYGGINSYVWQDTKDMGLKTEYWSVDPRDWTEPSTNELIKRVVGGIKDGDVVLLHSNHFATVKALPAIIDQLSQKGFQFGLQQ